MAELTKKLGGAQWEQIRVNNEDTGLSGAVYNDFQPPPAIASHHRLQREKEVGDLPLFAVDAEGKSGETGYDGTEDTRPEARINLELLGRSIATHIGMPGGEFDAVHPNDARILPRHGELQATADAFGSELQGCGLRVDLAPKARKKFGCSGGVRAGLA